MDERSPGAAVMALVAIALLGASFAFPWFEYDYNSGRQTPPGGPQEESDKHIEERHIEYAPNQKSGTSSTDGVRTGAATPTDPQLADQAVQRVAWALLAGIVILALMALGEIRIIHKVIRRRVGLALGTLALVPIVAALWIAWFDMPASLAGYGVTWPFTYTLQDDGYTRTTLDWGWALAALAFPAALAAILFKFQAGSADAALVEVIGGQRREGEA